MLLIDLFKLGQGFTSIVYFSQWLNSFIFKALRSFLDNPFAFCSKLPFHSSMRQMQPCFDLKKVPSF